MSQTLSRVIRTSVCGVVFVFLLILASAPIAHAEPLVTFTGHGFGHGIGMCQYGAKGMADAGKNYTQILTYYYSGVSIATYSGSPQIRVYLGTASTISFSSPGTYTVTNNATGTKIADVHGAVWKAEFTTNSAGTPLVRLKDASGVTTGTYTGPILVAPVTSSYVVWESNGAKQYYGKFYIYPDGSSKKLLLVNEVDFEKYVCGIGEVPSSWPMEALKAQAVAARSYAYYVYLDRRDDPHRDTRYHVYADTKDQVYVGKAKEDGYLGSRWRDAVTATARQVLKDTGQRRSTTRPAEVTPKTMKTYGVAQLFLTPAVCPARTARRARIARGAEHTPFLISGQGSANPISPASRLLRLPVAEGVSERFGCTDRHRLSV
jgi:peptidoglycan hydrolase-like amidase